MIIDGTNHKIPPYGVLAVSHSHTEDFKSPLHSHPFVSLFYVIAGKGFLGVHASESKKHIMELSADTAVLLEQGVIHQIIDKPRNPMTLFVIYFLHEPAENIFQFPDIQKLYQKVITANGHAATDIRKHLRRILNEQSQKLAGYETSITACMGEILVSLLRTSQKNPSRTNSAPKRVQCILEHIRHNFSQPYSLPEAADEINLSERQFTNLCRKITGMSFRKYLESLRLQRARKLLKTTNMPPAAIAFEVGYEELSTFYRAFKSQFNLSPIAYRNRTTK